MEAKDANRLEKSDTFWTEKGTAWGEKNEFFILKAWTFFQTPDLFLKTGELLSFGRKKHVGYTKLQLLEIMFN